MNLFSDLFLNLLFNKLNLMNSVLRHIILLFVFGFFIQLSSYCRSFTIGESSQIIFSSSSFLSTPVGGDTVYILSERKSRLQFRALEGNEQNPIVFINKDGLVSIKGGTMPAIMFENCKYIKISGRGDASKHYGFYLKGPSFGLSFEQYSTHCEAENLHIDSCSLGVHAKKDFGGHPPVPYPVFSHLAIHDNFIDHCSESMYIGETKSPGMEFRHVRIYNNVITNSGREAFQIANCVEDAEAYNNFCFNSGLENSIGQLNNSQLGGNSIGKFYNNIFIKAPADGVAIFGMGDMQISNNYFENNRGIYSDDRYTPIVGAPLRIENNYFNGMLEMPFIILKNSYFDLYVNNNKYNSTGNFLEAQAPLLKENLNNKSTTVQSFNYTLIDGLFQPDGSNPSSYSSIGPKNGLTHTFNAMPIIRYIPDIIMNKGDYQEVVLIATVEDNDNIAFSAKGLPSFVSLVQGPSGTALLKVDARTQQKGVYYVSIIAKDASHGAVARQALKIAVKEADNHPVTLPKLNSISMESAFKMVADISGIDSDGDSIRYSFESMPDFVDFVQTKTTASLYIKPTYLITGDYSIVVKAEDGYSEAAIDTLKMHIVQPVLTPGRVIYRVNYGGSELEDNPINWQKDSGNSSSYEANYSSGTGSAIWTGTNTTGAPNNLFGPYRYNGIGMEDMLFEYSCSNGRYEVNLFFAERANEVNSNQIEVFSIYLENELRKMNLNIYQQVGYNALKKSYIVDVFDGKIDLMLKKIANNSKLNGVEISYMHAINMPPQIGKIDSLTVFAGQKSVFPLTISDDGFSGCNILNVSTSLSSDIVKVEKSNSIYQLTFTPNDTVRGYFHYDVTVNDGCASTTISSVIRVVEYHPNAPVWSAVAEQHVLEGEKDTIFVQFTDADNDVIKLIASNLPEFVTFLDKGNGVGWILTQPNFTQSGAYKCTVTAKDDYGLYINQTIEFVVDEAQPIQRILLNNSMIHDLVEGGSVNSAALLVDEQSFDPILNQHPVSANWKPYFTNAKAPYHIYFDLGREYVIRKLKVHDMNNVGTLSFSIGQPGLWASWIDYSTTAYNSWVNFDVNIFTQFVRISQWNGSSAEVNELALYGYELNHKPLLQTIRLPIYALASNDTIDIHYTDTENDNIDIAAISLPDFAEYQPTDNGSGHIFLNSSLKAIGKYEIVLRANDSKNYCSLDTLRFEVTKDGMDDISSVFIEPKYLAYSDRLNKILYIHTDASDFEGVICSLSGRVLQTFQKQIVSTSMYAKGAYLLLIRDTLSHRILYRKLILI
ncbi:MAG: malectin domain-containing carbohydrate-binding protein [Bacteroidales bacterium]|nr:malectin domain-containing carbohydrate-binding protein [Bacteroidales bacterium]